MVRKSEDINIGLFVKYTRVKQGMRQEDLARKSGLNRSVVSHIENGLPNRLGIRTTEKLAIGLGVDIDWFGKVSSGKINGQEPDFLERDSNNRVSINEEAAGAGGIRAIIANRRLEMLVSQPTIARITGVDQHEIGGLERGDLGRIKLSHLAKVLKYLKINPNELGEVGEKLSIFEEVPDGELRKRHKKVCMAFRGRRNRKGIKLTELAIRIDMHKSNLSKVERAYSSKSKLWSQTMSRMTKEIGLNDEWFDEEYRATVAEVDNGSWVCLDCLKVWSRYRVDCECVGNV